MSDVEEDLESVDMMSEDSVINEIIEHCIEDDRLCYVCDTNGSETEYEIYDRSDLMDGGYRQRMVLAFEREHPPPWDEGCSVCDGEGCEECICEECERPCRMLNGISYGCPFHPVI